MAERKTSFPKATEEMNGAWRALPWRKLEQHCYRMQKRIYRARKPGKTRKDGDLLEVDYGIPTALGGEDQLSNKWVYHRHCHDEKTAEDMAHIARRKAEGINHK
jgi:hypothetical protein